MKSSALDDDFLSFFFSSNRFIKPNSKRPNAIFGSHIDSFSQLLHTIFTCHLPSICPASAIPSGLHRSCGFTQSLPKLIYRRQLAPTSRVTSHNCFGNRLLPSAPTSSSALPDSQTSLVITLSGRGAVPCKVLDLFLTFSSNNPSPSSRVSEMTAAPGFQVYLPVLPITVDML